MSYNKINIRRLNQTREKVRTALASFGSDDFDICLDWNEYNKLFCGKSNAIVLCPRESIALHTLGLFIAMNVEVAGRSTRVACIHPDKLRMALGTAKLARSGIAQNRNKYITIVQHLFSTKPVDIDSDVVFFIQSDDSLGEYEALIANVVSNVVDGRRVILFLVGDSSDVERLNLKTKFIVFDYTNEKKLVDDWFKTESTLVSPIFEMKLLEPGLNKRDVLYYAATNHRFKVKEYASTFPEDVSKIVVLNNLKEFW